MVTKKQIFIGILVVAAFIGGLMLGSSQPSGKGYHSFDEIYPKPVFETATPTFGQTCTTACSNAGYSGCVFGIKLTVTTSSDFWGQCQIEGQGCISGVTNVVPDIKKCSETGSTECACWS